MQRKPAPIIWVLFVLLVACSLYLLFNEQRHPVLSLAVLRQPGLGLVHENVQGFFVGNPSLILIFPLLLLSILFALYSKRTSTSAAGRIHSSDSDSPSPPQTSLEHSTSDKREEVAHSLAARVEVLKEELRKKDDFIGIASHELKTPLSSLKIYAQSLQLLIRQRGHSEYAEYLEKIDAQIDKLTQHVKTLLDVARFEGGKITYLKVNFDLNDLIASVVADLHHTQGTHAITREGKIEHTVYGDTGRISQVLENLISNAVKYSPGKRRVEIRLMENKKMAIVSVTDHGIGIEEKYFEDIFKRFFRIHRDIEGAYTGLGVGLFISCQIIEHHGGTMWVESTKGQGSTFYFSLPLREESAK